MQTNFCVFALAGLLALAAGTAAAQTPPPGGVIIAPTDKNLLYMGRWDRSDPASAHGKWVGSYVRVRFTGTSAQVILGGNSGLDIVIDNAPWSAGRGRSR